MENMNILETLGKIKDFFVKDMEEKDYRVAYADQENFNGIVNELKILGADLMTLMEDAKPKVEARHIAIETFLGEDYRTIRTPDLIFVYDEETDNFKNYKFDEVLDKMSVREFKEIKEHSVVEEGVATLNNNEDITEYLIREFYLL